MLRIKYLYTSSKMHLLPILLLSWMLGLYGVIQAVEPNDYTVEEDPIIQGIWEGQIDPALGWSPMPFFHPAGPYQRQQSPSVPFFSASSPQFMETSDPFMHNSLSNNPSMEANDLLMDSPNPFALPSYSLPASSLGPANNFSEACYQYPPAALAGSPLFSSTKPVSASQVTDSKNQQVIMGRPSTTAISTKSSTSGNHICTYCQKEFKKKSNLTMHLRIHTHDKPFQCTYCRKSFTQRGNLKKHLRTHTKERPFQCTCCSKSFTQKSSLKRHLRIHTDEKPYVCTYCDKKFTQQGNLKTHIRTHTKVKPYTCNYCNKGFSQKSSLKTHIKSQHE